MFRDNENPEVSIRNDDATTEELRNFLQKTYTSIVQGHFPPTFAKEKYLFGFEDTTLLRGPHGTNTTALAVAHSGADQLDSDIQEDN
ncbi:hypothetical protein [Corynebacterium pilosum]|nr:hypothetical protein [Corynebacterium pilosum]